jgi:hypothetical protein
LVWLSLYMRDNEYVQHPSRPLASGTQFSRPQMHLDQLILPELHKWFWTRKLLDQRTPILWLKHLRMFSQNDVPLSTQNARALATCVECRKPRVVYSKSKLSQRIEVLLATCLSEYEYSRGAPLIPPSAPITLKSSVVITKFFSVQVQSNFATLLQTLVVRIYVVTVKTWKLRQMQS